MTLGPVFSDLDHITPANDASIEIGFRRPSPFLLEGLEVLVRKPGPSMIGTGPFMVAPDSSTLMRSNDSYYLGKPRITEIRIATYPTIRAAWAEMLRNNLDMLYEVGTDALDSLEVSNNVSVFTFTRRYQYLVALNSDAPTLRSPEVRRALGMAIDRQKLIQNALNGHGVVSSGPLWPRYWALDSASPSIGFNPQRAVEILAREGPGTAQSKRTLRFTCLVPPDAVNERIALELKRQFAAIGVDMLVQEAPQEEILQLEKSRKYEAVLIDGISGPSLLRPYQLWHSSGAVNPGGLGNATIDAAFDRVRRAENEPTYRKSVGQLQQAFIDDPPAIFLAWSVRARAVSKRFAVPAAEPGREILSTLRLWQPAVDEKRANRN
jgi:ABC-type transport system substrate-binding protein